MSIESIEARVARGAAWLDEHHPGWERRIDLGRLNMLDCTRCIIGQALGDKAWVRLSNEFDYEDDTEAWTELHAFVQSDKDPALDPVRAAWVALIKERFDSGLLSDERDPS